MLDDLLEELKGPTTISTIFSSSYGEAPSIKYTLLISLSFRFWNPDRLGWGIGVSVVVMLVEDGLDSGEERG